MDGNCKTFDTSADGFARGEGMGQLLISTVESGTPGTPALK